MLSRGYFRCFQMSVGKPTTGPSGTCALTTGMLIQILGQVAAGETEPRKGKLAMHVFSILGDCTAQAQTLVRAQYSACTEKTLLRMEYTAPEYEYTLICCAAQATKSEDCEREVEAALRRAHWHASKLLVGSSSATALQLQVLTHTGTVLQSLAAVHAMPHVFDSVVPCSLDSIVTGAFTSTASFLHQQSAQSGVACSRC